jgi:hypothetical protein
MQALFRVFGVRGEPGGGVSSFRPISMAAIERAGFLDMIACKRLKMDQIDVFSLMIKCCVDEKQMGCCYSHKAGI